MDQEDLLGARLNKPVDATADQPDRQDGAGSPPSPISSHKLINFIHHQVVELVTVLYLVYVILGTLLPFDFALAAAADWDLSLERLGTARSSLPDVLSNIALYLPLGLLLHMTLVRRIGRSVLSIIPAVAAAMALSLSMEALQMFSPTRVSSTIDFWANSLGGCGGALLSALCRGPERRLLAKLSKELASDTWPTMVKAYACLLVIGALVPFTPTLDVSRLMGSVRSSTIIPLAQDSDLAEKANQAQAWGSWDDVTAFRRDRLLLWASWLAEALSFGLLGWLLHRLLRDEVGFTPLRSVAMGLYLASWLALVMSVLQIFILSRGFHSTDILFRIAGALGGYSLRGLRGRLGLDFLERNRRGRWKLAVVTILAAVGLILFTGLAPFWFDFEAQGFSARLGSMEIIPFYSYYLGRFDQVCADFWGKSLRYGFLAMGLWLWWPVRPGRSLQARTAAIALSALGLSLFIEVAQLFIPGRVPSISDVFIAGAAAWVAPICCQYVLDFYIHARAHHANRSRSQAGQPRMSPADRLIASLIQDASCEPGAVNGVR